MYVIIKSYIKYCNPVDIVIEWTSGLMNNLIAIHCKAIIFLKMLFERLDYKSRITFFKTSQPSIC